MNQVLHLGPSPPTAPSLQPSRADASICITRPPTDCPVETVMPYTQGLRGHSSDHEKATRQEVVRRLALLKGGVASEEVAQDQWQGEVYLVPSDTIVGTERARALGVHGASNLFGGVVPHAFVATKAITHPLVGPGAAAPAHWNVDFPEAVAQAVLPGYTVFSREDAREAARRLGALGPLRVKKVCETGGRGQVVVADAAGLEACLAEMDEAMLARDGLVLEHNLTRVETLSVGQVTVAGIVASYFGVQRLTPSNSGEMVYGGSDLTVVRGGIEVLRAIAPSDAVRRAVDQALVYDSAAKDCFAGFFASRINYDIAQGLDGQGEWRSGVLEQSWRAGGATGAEIAALEVFKASPRQSTVRARCVEIFGACQPVPSGAVVYFQGVDSRAGPLTKYTTVSTVSSTDDMTHANTP